MKRLITIAPIVIIAIPLIASAAVPTTLKELVGGLVTLLNAATTTLIALALVAFLYGAAYNMLKAGERGSGALREYLVWGIIILFVMVSIWGILQLLQNTLFGYSGNRQGAAETGVGAQPY